MGKKSRSKTDKAAKVKQEQERRQKEKLIHLKKRFLFVLSYGWKFVVALSVLLMIFSYFASRISVALQSPFNASEPFTATFFVSNNGYLPIHSVQIDCLLDNVKTRNEMTFQHMYLSRDEINLIAPTKQTTTHCDIGKGQPFGHHQSIRIEEDILSADISIVVSFRPDFFPWHKEAKYRFVAVRYSDGFLHWEPQSIPE